MRKPRFLRLFGKRSNRNKERARRLDRIQALGFQVEDKKGWFEGVFSARRYVVKRDELVIGTFLSSREALHGAEAWIAENPPSKGQ